MIVVIPLSLGLVKTILAPVNAKWLKLYYLKPKVGILCKASIVNPKEMYIDVYVQFMLISSRHVKF